MEKEIKEKLENSLSEYFYMVNIWIKNMGEKALVYHYNDDFKEEMLGHLDYIDYHFGRLWYFIRKIKNRHWECIEFDGSTHIEPYTFTSEKKCKDFISKNRNLETELTYKIKRISKNNWIVEKYLNGGFIDYYEFKYRYECVNFISENEYSNES
jgi:hypothetical protein